MKEEKKISGLRQDLNPGPSNIITFATYNNSLEIKFYLHGKQIVQIAEQCIYKKFS